MNDSERGRKVGLFDSVAGVVSEQALEVVSGKGSSSLANPEEVTLSTGVEVLGLAEIGSSSLGNSGRGFLEGTEYEGGGIRGGGPFIKSAAKTTCS